MREALARSDHDFVVSEPRHPNRRQRATLGWLILVAFWRLIYQIAAYPNRAAAALLVLVLVAITVNALVLQRGPHPAPLFGRAPAVPTAQPVSQPAAEAEVTKPAHDGIADLLTKGAPAPAPMPVPSPRKHVVADQDADAKASQDPISQLLKASPAPTPSSPPAPPPAPTPATEPPAKTVLSVQRALVKLGFVLKPDGINGAATRKALEQFERDRGLPPKGEFTPKVLRELAAQSGQGIE